MALGFRLQQSEYPIIVDEKDQSDALRKGLRGLSCSISRQESRERGGVVLAIDTEFEFRELPNYSKSQRRYVTVIRLADRPVGFWHTHPGSARPSPTDLLELLWLNRRFGTSFVLCILGAQAFSVTTLRGWRLPRFVHERL